MELFQEVGLGKGRADAQRQQHHQGATGSHDADRSEGTVFRGDPPISSCLQPLAGPWATTRTESGQ